MDKYKKLTKKRNRNDKISDDENSSQSDELSDDLQYSGKKQNEKVKNIKEDQQSEDDDILRENGEISFCLTSKKRLTIRKFKGNVLVDLREFWTDEKGVTRPTKKGIALTPDNWEKIKKYSDKIDEAIRNMKY